MEKNPEKRKNPQGLFQEIDSLCNEIDQAVKDHETVKRTVRPILSLYIGCCY